MTTSTCIYAKQLYIDDLLPEDIIWLDKALAMDYHGVTSKDILDGLVKGRFQFWRLGENQGVAVTCIQQYPGGQELYTAYLAGQGYFEHFEEFIHDMLSFAKAKKCRWYAGMAASKGARRIYERVGKQLGVYYMMSVEEIL